MLNGIELVRRFFDNVWEYHADDHSIYIQFNKSLPELCGQSFDYESFYKRYEEQFICPEDMDKWHYYMSALKLHAFLDSEREEEHFFVRTRHGDREIEWHEVFLEKKDETTLLVTSVNTNKEKRDSLIAQAVLPEFDYVCRIDIRTESYVIYYADDVRGPVPPSSSNNYHSSVMQFQTENAMSGVSEEVWQKMQIPHVQQQLAQKDEYIIYYVIRKSDGKKAHKKLRFCYADSARQELLLTRIDVTDLMKEREKRVQKEQKEIFLAAELYRNREEMDHILETTTDLVFRYSLEENKSYISKLGEAERSIFITEEDIRREVVDGKFLDKEFLQPVLDVFERIRNGEQRISTQIRARKAPQEAWQWYRMVMFDYREMHTLERKVVGYLQNIDKDIQEKEALRRQAQTDALTGLLNVGAGRKKAEELLKNQAVATCNALFVMDMDDFKKINDTLGHIAGDEALKCFAEVLTNAFGNDAVVYRLGGDEFAVFMSDIQERTAEIKRVMNGFEQELEKTRQTFPYISSSVGIFVSDEIKDYEQFYKKADDALYEAKRGGKNHYILHGSFSVE